MLKWIAIGAGILVVLWVLGYRKYTVLPLRRLDKFIRAQGIDFIRVRRGSSSYGWPSYVVMFDSVAKSAAFQRSTAFDVLVQEVQSMHQQLAGFEAIRAVSVDPIVRSNAADYAP